MGYLDGSFAGNSAATGMKPQSKLWFADGIWWAVMFNPSPANRLEIFRRDAATETWTATGAAVDGRRNVWSDAKWDGTHLYVVTHGASETTVSHGIRISRFAYDSAAQTWSLSSGFPLTNVGTTAPNTAPTGTEGAVVDDDGAGRIWLAWTRGSKVWVTHSTTDQTTFVAPYVPPAPNADNLTADDMATLVAYDGRVGVLWSNQNAWCMCFAIHPDGADDSVWVSRPMIGPLPPKADKSHEMADDHMNVKAANDGSGRLFAVSKTSRNQPDAPLLLWNVFNGATWSNPVTVTIDATAPQTTIGSAPASPTNAVTASIAFSSDEAGAMFSCRLDGSPWSSCTSPHATSGLAGGSHTFEVRATDGAGNVDATPAGHTWVVDATAPDTTIDSGPSGTVDGASATFTFSSGEAGSTFACRLDGGPYAACASPRELTGLAPGSHAFEVRATDAAGNTDAKPAGRTWQMQLAAFVDGFESGGFSAWSPGLTGGLGGDGTAAVVTDAVRTGSYAARLSETANVDSLARLRLGLPSPYTDAVTVEEAIRVEAEGAAGANVPLLRLFDAAGARVLSLYRQNGGSGAVHVSHGSPTLTTASLGRSLALHSWVGVRVRVVAGAPGAGTVTVTWNGVQAYTTSVASIGSPIATVQIGNDTKRQPFQLVVDDVMVSQR